MTTELANIALSTDNHPKGATPKLESVGQDVDERFFMLATFCFDLVPQAEVHLPGPERTLPDADPAFAKRILQDNEFINPGPGSLSWEEMAIRAEEVMKALWQEIKQEHFDENLREIAAKAP